MHVFYLYIYKNLSKYILCIYLKKTDHKDVEEGPQSRIHEQRCGSILPFWKQRMAVKIHRGWRASDEDIQLSSLLAFSWLFAGII